MNYKILDLFCGAGGFSAGLECLKEFDALIGLDCDKQALITFENNHSQAALEKLKLINKEQGKECLPKNLHGKQQFKSTWGRLNWNKISPTIDTRFDTPSNGTNSHPELHRSITPREAARIQSFSDNYIFYGNKTSVCKQIGNAVPPLLALALGKAILKSLRK
ncbi:DNA cytosine methyltransferase [Helicobacter pylori]|nr:DNA cytosine methyltransferase [Helicobacter pylori]